MLVHDYGKRLEQCLFLVGDNCSVNRRLATLMAVPLVGCASHCLNIAVRQYLSGFENKLSAVQALMVKLRTITQYARLRYCYGNVGNYFFIGIHFYFVFVYFISGSRLRSGQ